MRVKWFGSSVKAHIAGRMQPLLYDAGEHILGEANKTVPIEEGSLAGSGDVDADENSAVVSYDTPYARRQHEELQYQHAQGRRALWLKLTLEEEQRAVRDFLADGLRRAFR